MKSHFQWYMPYWLASLSSSFPVESILPPFYLPLVASLVAQTVKRLPAMQETQVQSLGREALLEKEMATHSSILAWKIPRMEELGEPQVQGVQRVGQD